MQKSTSMWVTVIVLVNLLVAWLGYLILCWHFIRGYKEVSNLIVWPMAVALALLNLGVAVAYGFLGDRSKPKKSAITSTFVVSAFLVLLSPFYAPVFGQFAKYNLWIETPIIDAARYGDAPLVKILLRRGADPNMRQRSLELTPLHYTAYRGETEAVKLLLNKGADPNAKAAHSLQTPLHWAARGTGSRSVIQLLLQHGANPAAKDSDGKTFADLLRYYQYTSQL